MLDCGLARSNNVRCGTLVYNRPEVNLSAAGFNKLYLLPNTSYRDTLIGVLLE